MKSRSWLVALGVATAMATVSGCNKEEPAKPEAGKAEAAKQGSTGESKAEPGKAEGALTGSAEKPAGSEAPAPTGEPADNGAPTEAAGEAAKEPAAGEGAGQAAAEDTKAAEPPAPTPTAADAEAEKARAAQEERQKKLQAIYELGRKRDEASLTELKGIMMGTEEPGIRATAIRVLGREPIESVMPTLKELTKSADLPVKMEAAIVLYQWGEKKFSEPLLDELSTQGVALRRAFLTGRKDGKNEYDPAAKKFLKKGLESENVYTRLDAALGLYEMGDGKTALDVFTNVMEKEETFYVRMAALNYLRHLKDDPQINKVITAATEDKDERVRERAKQILAEPAPTE